MILLAASVVSADNIGDGMINWVRSKGGSFNNKVEIRRTDPSDEGSPFGVFAKENLDEKELIMHVPEACYIEVWDAAVDMSELEGKEATDANHDNLCKLSHELMQEMKLGDKSQFAPYIAYLKTQKAGQLPVQWSKQGKEVRWSIGSTSTFKELGVFRMILLRYTWWRWLYREVLTPLSSHFGIW
jgi:hypothetical protein